MDKLKHITVVAGLIYNKDKYLIGRRKPDDLGGGYWEFPIRSNGLALMN